MGQYGRWIGPIQSSARWRRKREADNHEGFKLSGDSNLLFWQNCCGLGRDSRGEKFRGAEPLGTKKTMQVYTFPTWIVRWKRQAWWTVEPVWQMSSLDRSTLGWSLPPAQLMAPWVMKYLLIIHFFVVSLFVVLCTGENIWGSGCHELVSVESKVGSTFFWNLQERMILLFPAPSALP